MLENKKIKFWKVENISQNELKTIDTNAKKPGTILLADSKIGLYIQTIDGAIKVLEIQGENSKRMNIQDFLRGNKLQQGAIFS